VLWKISVKPTESGKASHARPFSDRHYLTPSTTLSKTSKDRDQEEERQDDLYYTKME
jgi:hypothetical protein